MPRKPLTENEKEATRIKAIAAGMELIERGEAVTIRNVAREMGRSAMGLYTYFKGHNEIIDALAGYALASELQSAAYWKWFFATIPIGHPVAQQIIKDGKAIQ